jgi:hypothetical protein
MRTSNSSDYDPLLYLMSINETSRNLYDNILAVDDDSAGGNDSLITYNLNAGQTYVIVATAYKGSGNYTLTITKNE